MEEERKKSFESFPINDVNDFLTYQSINKNNKSKEEKKIKKKSGEKKKNDKKKKFLLCHDMRGNYLNDR